MRKFLGVLILLMGLCLGGWIFYNLVIERLPETQGRSPIVPIAMSIGMIFVGVKWIKGEQAG